jgi:hypothetical protein
VGFNGDFLVISWDWKKKVTIHRFGARPKHNKAAGGTDTLALSVRKVIFKGTVDI